MGGEIRSEDGAPDRTRTCGTRFRKPLLYPLSYRGIWFRPTNIILNGAAITEALKESR